ncbi:hypothetical protein, partial [Streptomyces sp. NPDC056632]|uniref:hypothetical protein n=1 Tax=Streptomyces sp. NPDC056632 TaxID=3345884 RepID=UPI0036A1B483
MQQQVHTLTRCAHALHRGGRLSRVACVAGQVMDVVRAADVAQRVEVAHELPGLPADLEESGGRGHGVAGLSSLPQERGTQLSLVGLCRVQDAGRGRRRIGATEDPKARSVQVFGERAQEHCGDAEPSSHRDDHRARAQGIDEGAGLGEFLGQGRGGDDTRRRSWWKRVRMVAPRSLTAVLVLGGSAQDVAPGHCSQAGPVLR